MDEIGNVSEIKILKLETNLWKIIPFLEREKHRLKHQRLFHGMFRRRNDMTNVKRDQSFVSLCMWGARNYQIQDFQVTSTISSVHRAPPQVSQNICSR